MKKNYSAKKVLQACLLFFMIIITTNMFAQVGIGTTTPNASSILDLTSFTQGLLTPRMTTAQRITIASPADGLMVYDTDLKSFFHFDTSINKWDKINTDANYGRIKFKRIKSTDVLATVLAAEKAAGGTSKYQLDANTYYEINGTISFDLPIDLNNAYISGLDANEDKLVRTSGNLFDGATGGSIKNVTIQVTGGGKVFNLSGANTQNLIIRDTVIAGCSNVGSITGFGLVFVSIVQYVGNTMGIVYDSISKLLISNAAWFGDNLGTYETLKGSFGLIQKQGGFSEVNGSAIGFDVSFNPTITGDAIMETVVFIGTNAAGYVKGYSPAVYSGYNFDNNWAIRCSGIPNEVDAVSTGFLYDNSNSSATTTTATTQNVDYKVNTNTTLSSNLFRVKSLVSGRLTYTGKKTRTFQVNSSLSFIESTGGNTTNATYVFYIAKILSTGVVFTLPENETFIDTNSGFVQD
ncbi:MAG: hypothetical protein PSX42_01140, partial [bacterium]|nr:hypothetical protein [bacterium]